MIGCYSLRMPPAQPARPAVLSVVVAASAISVAKQATPASNLRERITSMSPV